MIFLSLQGLKRAKGGGDSEMSGLKGL